ncbi:MAG: DUF5126 domain-containing protein [Candidatus Symbiothrix sp.]|jgi:hypothetical protein|nr:DUF5126 domain-containing protein [Candidatus Symbiothrix sp.]
MKRLVIYNIMAMILSLVMVMCTELPHSQTPVDKDPPLSLNNIRIESLPGGAKITYDVANEEDISYVKAEYTYKGEKKIVRSSIFNNFLKIEGLGSVEPVEVTLYVIDHSENSSVGITTVFTPDTPPVETIFESLEISQMFGGPYVTFDNATETEVGVTLFVIDSDGVMHERETHYSKEKQGEITFRGYNPIEYHFAVHITDKWGNVSRTKDAVITPLFERDLDKTKFLAVELPGDNTTVFWTFDITQIWDGDDDTFWVTQSGFGPYPQYFTIDVGVVVRFSRFRVRARTNQYYCDNVPKTFEVWGAADYKKGKPETYWTGDEWKTDGDWEMLGDYELNRPSGNTEEICGPTGVDKEEAVKGFMYNIPANKKVLRYVRFIVKTSWTEGGTEIRLGELNFYGDDGSSYIE